MFENILGFLKKKNEQIEGKQIRMKQREITLSTNAR